MLAPPSYVDKPYQWIGAPVSPDQLLEAPAELLEWISKKQTTLRPASSGVVSITKGVGCATGWLKAVVTRVSTTPEGSRHKRLRGAAITAGGFIAAGRLDEPIARAALIDAGLQCGLPEQQSRNVVDWGIACGLQSPIEDTGNWKSQHEVGQKFSTPKWVGRNCGY